MVMLAVKSQMTLGFGKCPYFLRVSNPSYRTCCGRCLMDLAGGRFCPCLQTIRSLEFGFIEAEESLLVGWCLVMLGELHWFMVVSQANRFFSGL
jgi:hypothetical protein